MNGSPAVVRFGWLGFTLALGVGVNGCKDPPAPTQRTEPWRAGAASSAASAEAGHRVAYKLAPAQALEFELKTKTTVITGRFPLLRGSLDVDLMNLKNSRSKLEIDAGAVRISTGTQDESLAYSMRAQNWLNLGASIPDAVREKRRWATFLLEEVREVQADAAHEARVDRKRLLALKQQVQTDSEDEDAGAPKPKPAPLPQEVRATRAEVLGSLELNQRRVTQPFHVAIEFWYPAAATPGLPPDRIVVRSVRPVAIPLERHQIAPRDAAGMRIANDLKLLGSEVGKTARVSVNLEFLAATAEKH